MLEQAFQDVYTKFKLHFYQNVFQRFATREATLTTVEQMKQKSYSSTLTEVPGVGPKLSKALLAQFKSVGAVKEATPDQLENTPGVGKQMAQTIYDYFHTEA